MEGAVEPGDEARDTIVIVIATINDMILRFRGQSAGRWRDVRKCTGQAHSGDHGNICVGIEFVKTPTVKIINIGLHFSSAQQERLPCFGDCRVKDYGGPKSLGHTDAPVGKVRMNVVPIAPRLLQYIATVEYLLFR